MPRLPIGRAGHRRRHALRAAVPAALPAALWSGAWSRFPTIVVGHALTFQIEVATAYDTTYLDWAVTPHA